MAPNNHSSSLPVTGVINMTDLARIPVTFAIGALSRYAAARVNPYTAEIANHLCRGFRLGVQGHKNIQTALASLVSVKSIGNVLEFGFGIQDVVKLMARSEGGSTCLALCAALKDTFSDDVAVEILLELARLVKVDSEYMPSGLEWRNLLSACAGTLATSTFSIRAEFLMNLVMDEPCLGAAGDGLVKRPKARPKTVRRCSTPKSVAEALFHLAEISQGRLESITFIGGSDSGWLAAVAEWFLDLRVAILNEDGTEKYTNSLDLDGVQVKIVLNTRTEEVSQRLQCVEKTHRLEDASEMFEAEDRPRTDACVSGRVDWKNALYSTFHNYFEELMADPHCIGELIGSAARLFKALAQGHQMFSVTNLKDCTNYCDQSYGRGFINNMLIWFPELEKSKQAMIKAVSANVKESRRVYDHCAALIKTRCKCSLCQREPYSTWTGSNEKSSEESFESEWEETSASDANSNEDSSDDGDVYDDRYCLLAIAETIIVLGRSLAKVSLITKDMRPKRSGLELIYGRQCNMRRSTNLEDISKQGQIWFVLDRDFGADWDEESSEVRLQTILELFSGRDAPSISTRTSAVCVNGICAYLGILSDISVQKESVGRIHVLPGRIQYQKKSYDKVEDRRLLQKDEGDDFSLAVKVVNSDMPFKERTLSITERSEGLDCLLEITTGQAFEQQLLRVGPGRLGTLLASRQGLVRCSSLRNNHKTKCQRILPELVKPEHMTEAGKRSTNLQIGSKSINIFYCNDTYTAVAAIASSAHLSRGCSIYIGDRKDECLDCCVRTVLEFKDPASTRFAIVFLGPSGAPGGVGVRVGTAE